MTDRAAARPPAGDRADVEAILRGSLDAVLVADDERHYIGANDAACELLGRSRAEVLRLTVDDLAPPEARPWVADAWRQFRVDGSQAGSMVIDRPDGTVRHVEFRATANVEPGRHVSLLRDVTDRVTAEVALRRAQEEIAVERSRAERTETQLLLALGQIPTLVWSADLELLLTYVSNLRYGLSPDAIGRPIAATVLDPDEGKALERLAREALATGARVDTEMVLSFPDGPRICQVSIAPLLDEAGRPVGVTGATTDITSIREAERSATRSRDELVAMIEERTLELSASRRLSDILFAELGVVAWVDNLVTGERTYVSPGLERVTGLSGERFFDLSSWRERIHPDDRIAVETAVAALESPDVEFRLVDPDAATRWLRRTTIVVRDSDGTPALRYGIVLDVTTTRAAAAAQEAALRESERVQRELIEGVDAAIGYSDADGSLRVSARFEEIVGYPPSHIADFAAWERLVHPDDYAACRATWDSPATTWSLEYRMRHADGHWVWVRDRGRRTIDPDGRVRRHFFVLTDVTAAHEAEEAARASEQRYRRLIESQDAFFWEEELPARLVRYVSPQASTMTGYPIERWFGEPRFWRSIVHPEDRAAALKQFDRPREGTIEYRIVRADGRVAWVRDHATTIRDAQGRAVRAMGVVLDVTALRAADEERRILEERMNEVARLEALARMAATTAHDFGNVLIGIDVFADHLARGEDLAERSRADVDRIKAAVEQGRAAASALVSLGRMADPDLVRTDLHQAIRGLELSLVGLLGPDVDLLTSLGAPDATVEIDPGAFERALINLALNSRDAMEGRKGRVTITSQCVDEDESTPTTVGIAYAGRYVSVTFADDGAGMDAKTLARAFEPYFTTKPVGKGTGLGLSSVHALVRAADGHIHAESSRGAGTSFRICIPALAVPEAASSAPRRSVRRSRPRRGSDSSR